MVQVDRIKSIDGGGRNDRSQSSKQNYKGEIRASPKSSGSCLYDDTDSETEETSRSSHNSRATLQGGGGEHLVNSKSPSSHKAKKSSSEKHKKKRGSPLGNAASSALVSSSLHSTTSSSDKDHKDHAKSRKKNKKKSSASSSSYSSKGSVNKEARRQRRGFRKEQEKKQQYLDLGGRVEIHCDSDTGEARMDVLLETPDWEDEDVSKHVRFPLNPDLESPVFEYENENHPDLWWNSKELEQGLRECMVIVAGMRTSNTGKQYVKALTMLYRSYKKSATAEKSSKALQRVAMEPQARGLELHIGFPLREFKKTHVQHVVQVQAKLLREQEHLGPTAVWEKIRKESMRKSKPCRQFAFMVAQYDTHAALQASMISWRLETQTTNNDDECDVLVGG